jgi:nardilysin
MGSLAPYDNEVVKSPMDKRSYKTVHLSNGLFALLVHDPEIYPELDSIEGGGDGRERNGEEEEAENGHGEINGDESDGNEDKRKTAAASPPTKKVINLSLFFARPSQI